MTQDTADTTHHYYKVSPVLIPFRDTKSLRGSKWYNSLYNQYQDVLYTL